MSSTLDIGTWRTAARRRGTATSWRGIRCASRSFAPCGPPPWCPIPNIGTWMQNVGAAWLMTALTPSSVMVALVQAATSLPVFLVSRLCPGLPHYRQPPVNGLLLKRKPQ
jgi:transmembrane secretion effector